VDSIVETDIHEWHFETREETVYTKPMLLAIGDKWEESIAEARTKDAAFR
jgi:NADH-quinone oxidoreductase subunit I